MVASRASEIEKHRKVATLSHVPKPIIVTYSQGAKEFAAQLLGRIVSDTDLAGLAGALTGAEVIVSRDGQSLLLEVHHPEVEIQLRRLARDSAGAPFLRNQAIRKYPTTPSGFGLKTFAVQIKSAKQLNVERIVAFAAGYPNHPDGLNGYYTWMRFGFNAALDDADIELLPAELAGAKDLNDVIRLGGKDWWKANGYEREMVFDLSDDSAMMQIFRAYQAEKKRQKRKK
ncbi:MAG: hypothetical protein JNM09_25180 [Blastocatellia bacterium]|nr:hypothetical protein [Blastocatellia bacterium]